MPTGPSNAYLGSTSAAILANHIRIYYQSSDGSIHEANRGDHTASKIKYDDRVIARSGRVNTPIAAIYNSDDKIVSCLRLSFLLVHHASVVDRFVSTTSVRRMSFKKSKSTLAIATNAQLNPLISRLHQTLVFSTPWALHLTGTLELGIKLD